MTTPPSFSTLSLFPLTLSKSKNFSNNPQNAPPNDAPLYNHHGNGDPPVDRPQVPTHHDPHVSQHWLQFHPDAEPFQSRFSGKEINK